jgi:hypothetical protein
VDHQGQPTSLEDIETSEHVSKLTAFEVKRQARERDFGKARDFAQRVRTDNLPEVFETKIYI